MDQLWRQVRQAYPFQGLTAKAFDAVLEMITGRFRLHDLDAPAPANENRAAAHPPRRGNPATALSALQPRISWDRVHHRLEALPGSQRLALLGGGTIPDTGQFAVVTPKGMSIGEVDEEFVFERRVGDAFLLGTNAWRISDIGTDRVTVSPAEGAPAMVPFWHGENTGRSYDLGLAQGKFLRELAERIDTDDCVDWLERTHFLEPPAARNLRGYVRRQLQRTGFVPSDLTLAVEASRDPLGDWQVLVLSPLGSRLHLTLRLALESRLRHRLGYSPQSFHHDDGIMVRLTESDAPVLDLFEGVTPENLQDLVLDELADSALFALRFRQNAARALLMPRGQAHRRAPLWLQRLRGRDLLQVARRFPDFPIIAETFRECLHDHLDVPRARQLLVDIREGRVKVETSQLEVASPFAAGLLFGFQMATMYQYDGVEAEPGAGFSRLNGELLDQLVAPDGPRQLAIDPRAVHQVERRLRGVGHPPRSSAEMAEWLRRLGDASASDLEGPMAGFLAELEAAGRVERIRLPRVDEPERWVLAEEAPLYRAVFESAAVDIDQKRADGETILLRYLETHALVSLADVLHRYPFEPAWAKGRLEDWAGHGRLVRIATPEALQWSAPANYEQVQRGTLAALRREILTCPATQFADFVARWQGVGIDGDGQGSDRLPAVLDRLQGCFVPADLWEKALLPARLGAYQPRWLDETLTNGEWVWVGRGGEQLGAGDLAFFARDMLEQLPQPRAEPTTLDEAGERILDSLRRRGALFIHEVAQELSLSPGRVRGSLWALVRLGLVTNDLYDIVRRGETQPVSEAQPAPRRDEPQRLCAGARRRNRARPRPRGAGLWLPGAILSRKPWHC